MAPGTTPPREDRTLILPIEQEEDENYWYRMEMQFGRKSIVVTTPSRRARFPKTCWPTNTMRRSMVFVGQQVPKKTFDQGIPSLYTTVTFTILLIRTILQKIEREKSSCAGPWWNRIVPPRNHDSVSSLTAAIDGKVADK